jgi:hypothetical protein
MDIRRPSMTINVSSLNSRDSSVSIATRLRTEISGF